MTDLTKMNLIAIVQQLPKDDIEFVQTCITILEDKIKELEHNSKASMNFLKYLRKTYDKNDEMYELLGEAIYLLKGDSND